jgi:chromosomal replication initiator protein
MNHLALACFRARVVKAVPPPPTSIRLNVGRHLTGWPIPKATPEDLSIKVIIGIVCEFYQVPLMELVSARKDKESVRARHVAQYLCKKNTKFSFPGIAKQFGDRDHTAIMYAVRKIEKLRAIDPTLDDEISKLEARISCI